MKKWWRANRNKLYIPLAYPIARLFLGTMRYELHESEALKAYKGSGILCGLHSRGLMLSYGFRNKGLWVLISLSRDGELQNALYTKMGYKTIRGSTGRGGVKAAIEAIKMLKESPQRLIIAIDGPKGPRGVVQDGALMMAKKSGAALIPGGVSTSKRWILGTWDLYCVPKPYSRIAMVFGDPIFVPPDASDEQMEEIRAHLLQKILEVDNEADRIVGYTANPVEKQEVPAPSA